MKILLAITFVYGVLNLFFRLCRMPIIVMPFKSIGFGENKDNTVIGGVLVLFDLLFFYFSIIFQSWYWLFR